MASGKFAKVEHTVQMASLQDVFSLEQVEAFLDWLPREDVYAKMGKRSC